MIRAIVYYQSFSMSSFLRKSSIPTYCIPLSSFHGFMCSRTTTIFCRLEHFFSYHLNIIHIRLFGQYIILKFSLHSAFFSRTTSRLYRQNRSSIQFLQDSKVRIVFPITLYHIWPRAICNRGSFCLSYLLYRTGRSRYL